MDNYFAIDSITCIDKCITCMIYNPPETNRHMIRYYENMKNVNLFYAIDNNIKINIIEIKPRCLNFAENKIIIFSHGNAWNNFLTYDYLISISDKLNILTCTYDYPKYGLSEGELNENGCCKSLEIVVNHYLKLNYEITLVASSIGTGVLIDYVSKNNWHNNIILISPFMSIPSIIIGSTCIDNCIKKNQYSSLNKIHKIKCGVKIFHGINDEIININHAYNLYEMLPNKSIEPSWINNCNHNNILEKITMDDYNNILLLNDKKFENIKMIR